MDTHDIKYEERGMMHVNLPHLEEDQILSAVAQVSDELLWVLVFFEP